MRLNPKFYSDLFKEYCILTKYKRCYNILSTFDNHEFYYSWISVRSGPFDVFCLYKQKYTVNSKLIKINYYFICG